MTSSYRTVGALAAIALAATALVSQAQAATVSLSFAPPTITTAGDPVVVDIVVNGLAVATGGFDLKLDYGNLAFVSYTLGPDGSLGGALDLLDLSFGDDGIGTVSLTGLADLLILEPDLYIAQNSGGPFTIAQVSFTGVAPGALTLGLRDVALSDYAGLTLLECTGAACNTTGVPEPMTPLLVAAALGALAFTRKRKAV
ncbi:MAG: PEP-CTERM sorting domain-containing protein [Rubrivivax sp.]|nr:PEP-CTERM sorting domain-containing protein [Rubrivivax sp.]